MLSSLPRLNNSPLAKCGCKKHCMDFNGDHIATCTAHSGATKAHVWMVSVLGPLFRTAGHNGPHTRGHGQRGPTARRRGDPQLPTRPSGQPEPGLGPQHHPSLKKHPTTFFPNPPCPPPPPARVFKMPPPRNRVFKKTARNPRKESSKTIISSSAVPIVTVICYGSSSHPLQSVRLTHPQDIDASLHIAAQRKINSYMQQCADNQDTFFLPAIMSTSTRMHGEFCVFFFYRPTRRPRRTSLPLECHRNATNRNRSVSSMRHSTSR